MLLHFTGFWWGIFYFITHRSSHPQTPAPFIGLTDSIVSSSSTSISSMGTRVFFLFLLLASPFLLQGTCISRSVRFQISICKMSAPALNFQSLALDLRCLLTADRLLYRSVVYINLQVISLIFIEIDSIGLHTVV